jgi:hypothetical protein
MFYRLIDLAGTSLANIQKLETWLAKESLTPYSSVLELDLVNDYVNIWECSEQILDQLTFPTESQILPQTATLHRAIQFAKDETWALKPLLDHPQQMQPYSVVYASFYDHSIDQSFVEAAENILAQATQSQRLGILGLIRASLTRADRELSRFGITIFAGQNYGYVLVVRQK